MKRSLILILFLSSAACVTGCASLESVPSKFKMFVTRSPDAVDPLVNSGRVSESYRSAKRELKNADHTMIQFARWCEDRGDHLEARQRYLDVLGDNPENVAARVGVARVEFATGRKAEAEAILRNAAVKYPDHAEVWVEMGHIQSETEQWVAAADSLGKAADLMPTDQNVRYKLGLALARGGQRERAFEQLKVAVGESAALYNIGFLLQEDGRAQDAAQWYARALKSHPDERTRHQATQMLASLADERSLNTPQIASRPTPSRVIPEETSFQAYRETPLPLDRQNAAVPKAPAAPTIQVTAGTAAGATSVERPISVPSAAVSQASYAGQWKTQQAAQRRAVSNAQIPQWRGPNSAPPAQTPTLHRQPLVEPPMWSN